MNTIRLSGDADGGFQELGVLTCKDYEVAKQVGQAVADKYPNMQVEVEDDTSTVRWATYDRDLDYNPVH